MTAEQKAAEIRKALKANHWRAVNIYIHPNGVAFTNATGWSVATNVFSWELEQARNVMYLLDMDVRVRLYRRRDLLADKTNLLHH